MSDQPDPDCAAAKDFLSWARREGYAFESIVIGRVQLLGSRDLLPNIAAQVRAQENAERSAVAAGGDESVYASMPGAEHFPGARPA